MLRDSALAGLVVGRSSRDKISVSVVSGTHRHLPRHPSSANREDAVTSVADPCAHQNHAPERPLTRPSALLDVRSLRWSASCRIRLHNSANARWVARFNSNCSIGGNDFASVKPIAYALQRSSDQCDKRLEHDRALHPRRVT